MIVWDLDGLRDLRPGTRVREVTGCERTFWVLPGRQLSSRRPISGTPTSGVWSDTELRLDFPLVTETLLDHYDPARSSRSKRTASATGARTGSSKAPSLASLKAS